MARLEVSTSPYGMEVVQLNARNEWIVRCECGYQTPGYGLGSRESDEDRLNAQADAVIAWRAHIRAGHKEATANRWPDWCIIFDLVGFDCRTSVNLYR